LSTFTSEYEVCGDVRNGYKIYTESGDFLIYPGVTDLDVICIGGGGGGYDDSQENIIDVRRSYIY